MNKKVTVKVTVPMSAGQKAFVRGALRREESEYFKETLARLQTTFETMPRLREQDGKGGEALMYLHYFTGNSDWWIMEVGKKETVTILDVDGRGNMIERDIEMCEAFGFTCLNGWTDCAELGYINLSEITAAGAELDFHFEPVTLSEIKSRIAA